MSVANCKKMSLPKIADERGNLTFLEKEHVGFDIKRVYYLYDVPKGLERGSHAHKDLKQIMIPLAGSFDIHLDDGIDKKTFKLSGPNDGLYIAPGVWRILDNFSEGAVCLVVASLEYNEIDYIRNYDEFVNYVNHKQVGL